MNVRKKLATLAAAVPLLLGAGVAAAPAASATETCGSGYVCIYEGDFWDGNHHALVYRFYEYGTYNVYNLIGQYTVLNCQTDGAGATGYTGWNGGGSVAWSLPTNNCGGGLRTDLTSTYSVRLYA
ncbi:hypothetical protein ACFCX4_24640 [Kitasatospora sp. NPDC056327]|uniref:hypothetical protein n=1 Tax=Kitasatospora sp. NPDC056327 TaxID=3345785 RepID=UPI0035E11DFF